MIDQTNADEKELLDEVENTLKHLRNNLMDLTARNPLLNFKFSAKLSLDFANTDISSIADTILRGKTEKPVPIYGMKAPPAATDELGVVESETIQATPSPTGIMVVHQPSTGLSKNRQQQPASPSIAVKKSDLKSAQVASLLGFRGLSGHEEDPRPGPKVHVFSELSARMGTEKSDEAASETHRPEENPLFLQSLLLPDELGSRARELGNEAKLRIQETGSNQLFLILGFLQYQFAQGVKGSCKAPLISIPVTLVRKKSAPHDLFEIVLSGDEAANNIALREKLSFEYDMDLPLWDNENRSDGTIAPSEYFDVLEKDIAPREGWKVIRRAALAMVSFSGALIVKDLDPQKWMGKPNSDGVATNDLLGHALIQKILVGRSSELRERLEGVSSKKGAHQVSPDGAIIYAGNASGSFDGDTRRKAKERKIDEETTEIPLIYDADSSQHSALLDAVEGKNGIIEGPPGTGKSQTITNLIATFLWHGKTVLFVSEKLAAMQVVKSRLNKAGLGEFALELHSNKTGKKTLIDEINARLKMPKPQGNLAVDLEGLDDHKKTLKNHAIEIGLPTLSNSRMNAHQAVWRSEFHRGRLSASSQSKKDFLKLGLNFDLATLTPGHIERIRMAAERHQSALSAVSKAVMHLQWRSEEKPAHPLTGLFLDRSDSDAQDDFKTAIDDLAPLLDGALMAVKRVEREFSEPSGCWEAAGWDLLKIRDWMAQCENAPDSHTEARAKMIADFSADERSVVFHQLAAVEELSSYAKNHQSKAQEAGVFAPLTSEEIEAMKEALPVLQAFGVSQETGGKLPTIGLELRKIARGHGKAERDLNALFLEWGLSFDTKRAASQAENWGELVEWASLAPNDLTLRSEKLVAHKKTLDAANAEANGFGLIHSELNKKFDLDAAPSMEDIQTAISTLRENSAIKLFNKKWTSAVNLHRGFLRDTASYPKKPQAIDLQKDLEKIKNHLTKVAAWKNNPNLLEALPQRPANLDGLKEFVKMANWLVDGRAIQAALAVQTGSAIDPVTIKKNDLDKIVASREMAKNAKQSIYALRDKIRQASRNESAMNLGDYWESSDREDLWSEKSKKLESAANKLLNAGGVINGLPLRAQQITVQDLLAGDAEFAFWQHSIHQMQKQSMVRPLLAENNAPVPQNADTKSVRALIDWVAKVDSTGISSGARSAFLSKKTAAERAGWITDFSTILVAKNAAYAFFEKLRELGRLNVFNWVTPTGIPPLHGMGGSEPKMTWQIEDLDIETFFDWLAKKNNVAILGLASWQEWFELTASRNALVGLGLEEFAPLADNGDLIEQEFVDIVMWRLNAALVKDDFARRKLNNFNVLQHEKTQKKFVSMDRKVINQQGARIAQQCWEVSAKKLVAGRSGSKVGEFTEMVLIDHLVKQTKPIVPLRSLLRRSKESIQAIKPCFMMSPQSVAQYLTPGEIEFDLLIMDEASQLPPEMALGAIARAKQIIIVGDTKQLPPSSFFKKQASPSDHERSVAADSESILEACGTRFGPVRTLRWHYRSQHESLIALSNKRFYNGDLIVFPSPKGKQGGLGLSYEYVSDGIYENNSNVKEAQRVAKAVFEHIKMRPNESLGVVAMNEKQCDLIEKWVDRLLADNRNADDFRLHWKNREEEFFVKNIETVQGDERDRIIISTTFGPKTPENRKVHQNFGPINREGGWRRLNVLFTRAKKSIAIFSSMSPEDITNDTETSEGPKSFRAFLEYAKTGKVSDIHQTGQEPDSDFERAVIEMLEKHGYSCVPQLGVSSFRIDLAIRHPYLAGGFLAAIECDGAAYHSGQSVRDRDRLRQQILESMGWDGKIYRIWSTSWFNSREQEIAKLLSFLSEKMEQAHAEERTRIKANEDAQKAGIVLTSPTDEEAEAVLEQEMTELAKKMGVVPIANPDSEDRELDALEEAIASTTHKENNKIAKNPKENIPALRITSKAPAAARGGIGTSKGYVRDKYSKGAANVSDSLNGATEMVDGFAKGNDSVVPDDAIDDELPVDTLKNTIAVGDLITLRPKSGGPNTLLRIVPDGSNLSQLEGVEEIYHSAWWSQELLGASVGEWIVNREHEDHPRSYLVCRVEGPVASM